jgi:hypothetical protein
MTELANATLYLFCLGVALYGLHLFLEKLV